MIADLIYLFTWFIIEIVVSSQLNNNSKEGYVNIFWEIARVSLLVYRCYHASVEVTLILSSQVTLHV